MANGCWNSADSTHIRSFHQRLLVRVAHENLIDHIHETDPSSDDSTAVADGAGTTLRQVVADALPEPVAGPGVDANLRGGDPVEKLRTVVPEIKSSPFSTTEDYGNITFRNQAYRYTLTETAAELYGL